MKSNPTTQFVLQKPFQIVWDLNPCGFDILKHPSLSLTAMMHWGIPPMQIKSEKPPNRFIKVYPKEKKQDHIHDLSFITLKILYRYIINNTFSNHFKKYFEYHRK